MWIWGLFCEPSPDTSYVMMTQCEIDMWCQTMAEQHRVIISRFDLEKDFHPGWCSWPLGDHLMFEILDPFSLQGPVQSPMWATIFVVTPLPRPWIPAVETWEIEPVRWLFNMPATRPRNILAICSISVTHWQRCAHFSKHFYHCCRGGWLPCLLRLRKLGVHGICFCPPVFPIRIIYPKLDKLVWFLPSVYGFFGHQCSMLFDFGPDWWILPGRQERFHAWFGAVLKGFASLHCFAPTSAVARLKSVHFHPGPLNGIPSQKWVCQQFVSWQVIPNGFCTQYPQKNIRSV